MTNGGPRDVSQFTTNGSTGTTEERRQLANDPQHPRRLHLIHLFTSPPSHISLQGGQKADFPSDTSSAPPSARKCIITGSYGSETRCNLFGYPFATNEEQIPGLLSSLGFNMTSHLNLQPILSAGVAEKPQAKEYVERQDALIGCSDQTFSPVDRPPLWTS